METLFTTITLVQHLIDKTVGIGLVRVVQAAIFGTVYASHGVLGDNTGIFDSLSEGKNSRTIILVVIRFVLGYLLYFVTAAILGSVVFSVQEVQQLMYILIIPLFIAMLVVTILVAGLGSDQTTIVSSYIPYLSPIAMYVRYMSGDASLNTFTVVMGINLVFTMILAFLGKSVHQGSVFIYSRDKPIGVFKEAFKSRRYYVRWV